MVKINLSLSKSLINLKELSLLIVRVLKALRLPCKNQEINANTKLLDVELLVMHGGFFALSIMVNLQARIYTVGSLHILVSWAWI